MSSDQRRDADVLVAMAFLRERPEEAALVLEQQVDAEQACQILSACPVDTAAAVLDHLTPDRAAGCLVYWPRESLRDLFGALAQDTAARLLRRMSPADRGRLLEPLDEKISGALQRLLRYPPGTAGALMDPAPLAMPGNITVSAARSTMERAERFHDYVYIVNHRHALLGVVALTELLKASGDKRLEAIMRRPAASLPARAGPDAILRHPGWRDRHALPVVDAEGRLVGVLGYEVLRTLQEGETGSRLGAVSVSSALGELYWAGTTRVLREMLETLQGVRPSSKKGD